MPSLMLPAGPRDNQQRREYLKDHVATLKRWGWTVGVELKTNIGEWAEDICHFVKENGGYVTWHVPDKWMVRAGFNDFKVSDLIEKLLPVRPFFDKGLVDAAVFHCGSLRWVDEFDPSWTYVERYRSPSDSREILEQIERHRERFAVIAGYLGGHKVLIENTPLTLWVERFEPGPDGKQILVGMDNFLGPFIGTLETVLYLARMTGTGVVLDTGHLNDFLSFMKRLAQVTNSGEEPRRSKADQKLFNIAGYWNSRGKRPFIHRAGEKDISWYIRHCHFRLFHIDACRAAFYDGKPDCERPVLNKADADVICLDEIIRIARANPDCLGMVVENVGSDVYPFVTERPTDWEGKRRTFEFIEERIAALSR